MNLYSFIASRLLKLVTRGLRKDHGLVNTTLIRQIVCYNQSRLADYIFALDETHKKLKEVYGRVCIKDVNSSKSEISELRSLSEYLSTGTLISLKEIAQENFSYMHKAYSPKAQSFGDKFPKFSIKSGYYDGHDYKILNIATSSSPTLNSEFYAADNTAFSVPIQTGSYFLCNDIPKAIKENKYKSSSIATDEVRKYYSLPGNVLNLKYRFSKVSDMEWMRCWHPTMMLNGIQQRPPKDFCYKSILVIPISLNTTLFSSIPSIYKDSEADVIVLGFLWIEHENIKFFNKKDDIDICYIFADIMSLYLLQWLKSTTYSAAFQKAQSLVGDFSHYSSL